MAGVERIGQYDVTPMKNGQYAVALNNGNIGAFVTDAKGVEEIRQKYESLTPEQKAEIDKNVKYPLLRTPDKDTVSFKGVETDGEGTNTVTYKQIKELDANINYTKPSLWNNKQSMTTENGEIDLVAKEGMFGRYVKGNAYGKDFDIKIARKTPFIWSNDKGSVKGTIGDKEINLKYKVADDAKGIELTGDIEDKSLLPIISVLVSNKIQFATAQATMM